MRMKIAADPLLALSRMLLTFLMMAALVLAAGAIIGAPVALVGQFLAPDGWGVEGERIPAMALSAVATLLALLGVLAVLVFLFLRNLRRIVDSVAEGDPFAPVNAERLTRMAWLAVAAQVVSICVEFAGQWLDRLLDEGSVEIDIALTGLLIALVLFVLARVFKQGAAMREDLEGTV